MSEIQDRIKDVIDNEPVVLFMKGTPQFIMCGNSDRALRALRESGAPVTAVNVLLDPAIRHELWSLITDMRARDGMTLVLTTHYLEEAERLCERLAIMDKGRVVAMDAPAALLARLGDEMLEVDGATELVATTLGARGIPAEDVFRLGSTVTVPFRNGHGDEAVRALRDASLPIRSISVRRPTLDDVYLRLTGASLEG